MSGSQTDAAYSSDERRSVVYAVIFTSVEHFLRILPIILRVRMPLTAVTLILGQVWYLIVSIPDLCTFTYFSREILANFHTQGLATVVCF